VEEPDRPADHPCPHSPRPTIRTRESTRNANGNKGRWIRAQAIATAAAQSVHRPPETVTSATSGINVSRFARATQSDFSANRTSRSCRRVANWIVKGRRAGPSNGNATAFAGDPRLPSAVRPDSWKWHPPSPSWREKGGMAVAPLPRPHLHRDVFRDRRHPAAGTRRVAHCGRARYADLRPPFC
jgi:hypothetical protein